MYQQSFITNSDQLVCFYIKKFDPTVEHSTVQKILTHLDKQDSPMTANSCRAPPLSEPLYTTQIDDYEIQRDFDFGA